MTIKIVEDDFGEAVNPITELNTPIKRFTFNNNNKMSFQVITLGATITSIKVPDKHGNLEDVVLGYDNAAGYQSSTNPYFGATIGRVGNRIANGRFKLNGKEINVSKNWNNKHTLHGGFIGFDKVIWNAKILDKNDSVEMSYISKDGEEGFPGELDVKVIFKLTDDNDLCITFLAITKQTTVINLTNHSYFNLAGHTSGNNELYKHKIMINADRILATDEDSVPTGDFIHVHNTPYDFLTIQELGPKMKAFPNDNLFDNNFCINLNSSKNENCPLIARAEHTNSGRWMNVYTDQPGVQFYTSNFMPDLAKNETPISGKSNSNYGKHGAFCLETQKYPDAVNHNNFPSIVLQPDEKYVHNVIYRFGILEN